jgi:hypothetical protein
MIKFKEIKNCYRILSSKKLSYDAADKFLKFVENKEAPI